MFTRILILILLAAAAACAPNPIQNPIPARDLVESTLENTKEPSLAATATPSPAVENGLQKKFASLALKDLAKRLNVDAEAIRVVSIQPIEWPNAALGCPAPGKVYAQGIVRGFRIELEVDKQQYFYHTDQTGEFVLCPEENSDLPERPAIPVTPGEIDDGEPWVPVD